MAAIVSLRCMGGKCQRLCVIGSRSHVSWLHWKIDGGLPHGVGIGCWVCARVGAMRDSTWTTCLSNSAIDNDIKQHAWTAVHRRAVCAYLAHMGLRSMDLDSPPAAQFQMILEAARRGAIVNKYMPGVPRSVVSV